MKRWDKRGRSWNNPEVHFWWESPFTAAVLLGVLALVMALL
jgi:hypothetical protein